MAKTRALDGAFVVFAALVTHARTAWFDFTYLDDRDLVVDDHAFLAQPASMLHAFARSYMHVVDGHHAYYRPLVTVSYAADAQWSGLRPFGYHCTNVALHAVASALLLALARHLGLGRALALVAATVFAVHPVLASAVAWIPGRNDELLAVFALAAWLSFVRELERPSPARRLVHLAFFTLALFTKETAVAIPLVCLAHVALIGPEAGGSLKGLVVGWGAAIAGRLLAYPRLGDATALEAAHNLRLLAVGLGKVLLPFNPSLVAAPADLPLWPGLLCGGAIAATLRFLPAVRPRVVALGIAAFGIFLAPALPVSGTLVLDNRLYLPACGAILVVAEVVRAIALERRSLAAFASVTVLALAALTAAYEESFHDRRAFARNAVASSPHSGLAHFCLGQTYQIDGDPERALAEYRIALALGASEVVHNNIAVIHMADARWEDAERELRQEIEIDPEYGRAYHNLGIVLRREGRLDDARAAEDRARELREPEPTR
jgi:tetratricopeptide (TPR) repeat protein